jgi:glyoxylase-like metal-dependent hydrolase (beta-lactamase superfamily II)
VLADRERARAEQVRTQAPSTAPTPVAVAELADGDEIDPGGGVSAVAVAVPGHPPGSVAFHLAGPRMLVSGDTVARRPDGTVIPGVVNVDRTMAVGSRRRQAGLDVDVVCFSHGEPLTEEASAARRAAAANLG